MLNEAVRALKAGEEPDLDAPSTWPAESTCTRQALLPSDYCPDVHSRLAIYKRLSHADGEDDLIRIQEELIDRFGKLPEAAQTLLATHRLRLAAQPLGIVKIDASETQSLLQFGAKTTVDPLRIIELVQRQRHIKLSGQDKLQVEIKAPQIAARADAVRAVLRALEITAALGAAGTSIHDYPSPRHPVSRPGGEHAEQLAALAQAQGVTRISTTAARLLDVQQDGDTRSRYGIGPKRTASTPPSCPRAWRWPTAASWRWTWTRR